MTNLLLTLHAVANCLITIAAVGLFWHAWRTDQKSKMTLQKISERIMIEKIGSILSHSSPQGGIRFEDMGSDSLTDEEQKNRSEWREYLRKTKDEALLTYPEWLEKRKEVANG